MATQRKNKRKIWLWTGLIVLVAAVALGIAVAARGNTTKFEPSQLAKAELGDIARSVVATGKVQPITKVEVKSKASGIVTRLDMDINDHVKQGQVLAQLDQQEILDQVAAQKAQLAAAESNARAAAASIQYDKVNAEAPDLPMYKNTYERNLEMSKAGRRLPAVSRRRTAEVSRRRQHPRQSRLTDQRRQLQASPGRGAGRPGPGLSQAA